MTIYCITWYIGQYSDASETFLGGFSTSEKRNSHLEYLKSLRANEPWRRDTRVYPEGDGYDEGTFSLWEFEIDNPPKE